MRHASAPIRIHTRNVDEISKYLSRSGFNVQYRNQAKQIRENQSDDRCSVLRRIRKERGSHATLNAAAWQLPWSCQSSQSPGCNVQERVEGGQLCSNHDNIHDIAKCWHTSVLVRDCPRTQTGSALIVPTVDIKPLRIGYSASPGTDPTLLLPASMAPCIRALKAMLLPEDLIIDLTEPDMVVMTTIDD